MKHFFTLALTFALLPSFAQFGEKPARADNSVQEEFKLAMHMSQGEHTDLLAFRHDQDLISSHETRQTSYHIIKINHSNNKFAAGTLELVLEGAEGFAGETVNIAVKVGAGFTDITSLSFSLGWDVESATYVGVTPSDIFKLETSSLRYGQLGVGWSSSTRGGESIPKGKTLFTLQMKLIGEEGSSGIDFATSPIEESATNAGGETLTLSTKGSQIKIKVNQAPTDLSLSNTTIVENKPSGTPVGKFTTTDPDNSEGFTYALVEGNNDFKISGDGLLTNATFNYEETDTYNIRVRTTDSEGAWLEKDFEIQVSDVKEASSAPLELVLEGAEGFAGETVNIAVKVGAGFTDITSLSFSLGWDVESATYVGVTPSDIFKLETSSLRYGQLGVGWSSSTRGGGSIPKGKTLFTLQMKLIGEEGSSGIDFATSPIEESATNAGGETLTLSTKGSQIKIKTKVNQAPTDLSLSNTTIAENKPSGTEVGSFTTTDPDNSDGFTYALVSGDDSDGNGAFKIDGNKLVTDASFDYEVTTKYSIRVRTTDPGGKWLEKVFEIQVSDVDDTNTTLELKLENAEGFQGETVNIPVKVGDGFDKITSLSFSLGWDVERATFESITPESDFSLDKSGLLYGQVGVMWSNGGGQSIPKGKTLFTLQLKLIGEEGSSGIDFSNAPVELNATKLGGGTVTLNTQGSQIKIKANLNQAPTNLSLSKNTVAENKPQGTLVGKFTTTDPDNSNGFTYSLVSGEGSGGNGVFKIDGDELETDATFDYEATSKYSIRVRTTDPGGEWLEKAFEIQVSDVDEADPNSVPTDIKISETTLDENNEVGAEIGTLSAVDADEDDTHTFKLVSGDGSSDNNSFKISGDKLIASKVFDYEEKQEYNIRIEAEDDKGGKYPKSFTIKINDVDENTKPTDLSLSKNTVEENKPSGTLVGKFTTTDPDNSEGFTYTLVSGEDSGGNSAFKINGNELVTNAIFDYEETDTYSIRVRTTDPGEKWLEKVFEIKVSNVDETEPNNAPTNIQLSKTTLDENNEVGTVIGTLSAVDADEGDTHTFKLVGGDGSSDNNSFNISENKLIALEIFDFEEKAEYKIRIEVEDNKEGTHSQAFTIKINDVNESSNNSPTDIALDNNSVEENQPQNTPVGSFTTADADAGDTHTYALVAGTGDEGNAFFRIQDNQLLTATSFDFETKTDYSIRVETKDGSGGRFAKTFTITIVNQSDAVNIAPTNITLSNNAIDENQPVSSLIGSLLSEDPDNAIFTYSLVPGAGSTHNYLFDIVENKLRTGASFDFETLGQLSIRIQTDDGRGGAFSKPFTILVNDVDDAPNLIPTDIRLSGLTVEEDQPAGALVGRFSASDPDVDDAHTFRLIAGEIANDNRYFTINNDQLLTDEDFNPALQESYIIRVQTDDGHGGTYAESFVIGVVDGSGIGPLAVANPIEDQQIAALQAFSLEIPGDVFQGTSLSLTVTLPDGSALPDWLTFDASTNTLSGTPPAGSESLTLQVTATNLQGDSVSDEFILSIDGVTAIGDEFNPVIRVYPVPAEHTLLIATQASSLQSYRLMDTQGHIVDEQTVTPRTGSTLPIDVSSLAGGVYFLELQTTEGMQQRRILVQ